MSVTLEEAHILLQEMQMESSSFQQALDAMRRCVCPSLIKAFLVFCPFTHSLSLLWLQSGHQAEKRREECGGSTVCIQRPPGVYPPPSVQTS